MSPKNTGMAIWLQTCLLFGAGLVAILFTIRDIERKFVAPILHKLRDEGIIKLIQVDLDKNRPLGEKFGITAIPTLLFFKDGEMLEGTIEVQNQPLVQNGLMVGAAGEPVLREIISQMG